MEAPAIQQWTDIAIFLSSVAGVLGGIWAFLHWVWPRLKGVWDSLESVSKLPTWQDGLDQWRAELDISVNRMLRQIAGIPESLQRIERQNSLQTELMRAFANYNEHPMFEADAQGRWLWTNELLQRWLGRGASELLGFGWMNSIAQHVRDELRVELRITVQEQRELRRRVTMQTVEGTLFDADWHVTLVKVSSPDPEDTTHMVVSVEKLVGNMRKRYATGEQPALRITHEDNVA